MPFHLRPYENCGLDCVNFHEPHPCSTTLRAPLHTEFQTHLRINVGSLGRHSFKTLSYCNLDSKLNYLFKPAVTISKHIHTILPSLLKHLVINQSFKTRLYLWYSRVHNWVQKIQTTGPSRSISKTKLPFFNRRLSFSGSLYGWSSPPPPKNRVCATCSTNHYPLINSCYNIRRRIQTKKRLIL
jgi:hypothetical protein